MAQLALPFTYCILIAAYISLLQEQIPPNKGDIATGYGIAIHLVSPVVTALNRDGLQHATL